MRLLAFFSGLIIMTISGSLLAGIINTKHNLSTNSTASIKATDGEQEICIFCHTPHNANPVAPLWNRNSNGNFYTAYDSTTFSVDPNTPTGSSLLCLSCHDGTIALGDVFTGTDITLTDTYMPVGATRLGTDLSDDHPISFNYASAASLNTELEAASTLTAEVRLDGNGEMQCTSCHDPHVEDNTKFLVKSNTASALCTTCHTKNYWTDTSHNTSMATWNSAIPDPWPHTEETTVADNACENCHKPHTAGNAERILNYSVEEDNCYACHNGNVANYNIENEFTAKVSGHPIDIYLGDHDAAETNVVNAGTPRHVECFDCHNPHGAQSNATNELGPLNGARGVNINGANIDAVNYPYEVCFRCHGDSTGKPAALTIRQFVQTNTREEYNSTDSQSYHPVATPISGAASSVPSLINDGTVALTLGGTLTNGGTISCMDCHNNDENPNNGVGGIGPSGPHGSINSPILERNYTTLDGTTATTNAYAMCYKCHDKSKILGNDSQGGYQSFQRHNFHITGTGARRGANLSTPCNICHDPHASGSQDRLINFDTSIVSPNFNNTLEFIRDATNGQCSLSCHGRNHDPCGYNRSTGAICGTCGGGPQGGSTCPTIVP